MQKEQREIEKRYDTGTTQTINEVSSARAVEGTSGRDQTKQVGTQDNREAQPQEGDPDRFTAGKDQSGKVEVETKKRKSKLQQVETKAVPFKEIVAYESVQGTTDGVTALAKGGKLGPTLGYGIGFITVFRGKFINKKGAPEDVKVRSSNPNERGSVFTGYIKSQKNEGKNYIVNPLKVVHYYFKYFSISPTFEEFGTKFNPVSSLFHRIYHSDGEVT